VSSEAAAAHQASTHHGALAKLTIGALGVVYGDIGTSPLYALRECFAGPHAVALSPEHVLGVLSLVFWSLLLVVVVKYLVLIMRVDNQGEGGILALLSLALPGDGPKRTSALILAGLCGAALLYSDGMLTPAISVVSAVEGLAIVTQDMAPLVVPLSMLILVVLFAVQRGGTASVGAVFGPLMAVWFVLLAAVGLPAILARPDVLYALDPIHAIRFLLEGGPSRLLVLGSVVLCITGAEALYADMGHFGRRPIRLAWYGLVFPALLINYFGQGALLLASPTWVHNPFYGLVPRPLLLPAVGVATLATVIASQALISGAFSLTRQAIQLGFLPRLDIVHTSSETRGQIYIPEVNRILMVACLALVFGFGSSSRLSAAYGMAVTGTMTITSVLFFVVAKRRWNTRRAILVTALFLAIDLPFLGANLAKLAGGAWAPLAIAAGVVAIMTTWKKGRARLARYMGRMSRPVEEVLAELRKNPPARVPGTAVFMTSSSSGTPPVLLHHLRHNKVLHEQVVLMSVIVSTVPFVSFFERATVEPLTEGFYRVVARYGFMQVPNMIEILKACQASGLHTRQDDTSFYLGRERLVVTKKPGMLRWRKHLFAFLSRNAHAPTDFFRLPPDRVMELGLLVEL
jgi:KUP system potassium uptake protein